MDDIKLQKIGESLDKNGPLITLNTDELQKIPVLYWRSHPRLRRMKEIIDSGLVAGASMIKISALEHKNTDLDSVILRETDICTWLADSAVESVYAVNCGARTAVTIILKNAAVCVLELASVLEAGERPVRKHEFITEKGVVMDKTVDTQAEHSSVYLFNADGGAEYNDPDIEQYGMSYDDILINRYAMDIYDKKICARGLIKTGGALLNVLDAVRRSVETGSKIKI